MMNHRYKNELRYELLEKICLHNSSVQRFLRTEKTLNIKEKISWTTSNLNICAHERTLLIMKRQTRVKETFTTHISDKEVLSRICKNCHK